MGQPGQNLLVKRAGRGVNKYPGQLGGKAVPVEGRGNQSQWIHWIGWLIASGSMLFKGPGWLSVTTLAMQGAIPEMEKQETTKPRSLQPAEQVCLKAWGWAENG